jgi:methylated-DNA-[protein]-cysteine S-methyltransferase
MNLAIDTFESPLGPVTLASDGRALVALQLGGPAEVVARRLQARYGSAATIRERADPQGFSSLARAYFAGELEALASCPVDGGGTPFQRRVWAALRQIPAGRTESYSALAARLGLPRAARAVGLANGRNPIAIAVPCHRVIGADGSLTGYAGGIERKRWLLGHEAGRIAGGLFGREVAGRSASADRSWTGAGVRTRRPHGDRIESITVGGWLARK